MEYLKAIIKFQHPSASCQFNINSMFLLRCRNIEKLFIFFFFPMYLSFSSLSPISWSLRIIYSMGVFLRLLDPSQAQMYIELFRASFMSVLCASSLETTQPQFVNLFVVKKFINIQLEFGSIFSPSGQQLIMFTPLAFSL